MSSRWVVTVWILAGIEKQADDLNVPKLGGPGEGAVSKPCVGVRKSPSGFLKATRCRGCCQVDSCPTEDQCIHRFELAVSECRPHGTIGVGSVVAQEIDERQLHPALARHPTGTHEVKCRGDAALLRVCARVENCARHLDRKSW